MRVWVLATHANGTSSTHTALETPGCAPPFGEARLSAGAAGWWRGAALHLPDALWRQYYVALPAAARWASLRAAALLPRVTAGAEVARVAFDLASVTYVNASVGCADPLASNHAAAATAAWAPWPDAAAPVPATPAPRDACSYNAATLAGALLDLAASRGASGLDGVGALSTLAWGKGAADVLLAVNASGTTALFASGANASGTTACLLADTACTVPEGGRLLLQGGPHFPHFNHSITAGALVRCTLAHSRYSLTVQHEPRNMQTDGASVAAGDVQSQQHVRCPPALTAPRAPPCARAPTPGHPTRSHYD